MTLPGHLRTGGTSILTLVRNIGSSIGISMVIAQLTSTTHVHACAARRERDAVQSGAADAGCAASMLNLTTDAGRAMMDAIVTQQAVLLAYLNDYKLLMFLTLAVDPADLHHRDRQEAGCGGGGSRRAGGAEYRSTCSSCPRGRLVRYAPELLPDLVRMLAQRRDRAVAARRAGPDMAPAPAG